MNKMFQSFIPLSLLAFLFAASHATAQDTSNERAQIGFNALQNENSVKKILDESEAKPKALYFWNSGISATFRTDKDLSSDDFFIESKITLADTLSRALESSGNRIKKFVEDHSESEVANDAELQQQLRSLLNLRDNLQNAVANTDLNEPSVFGIELQGKYDDLGRVTNQQSIGKIGTIDHASSQQRANLKPQHLKIEQWSPDLLLANPEALYRRAAEIQ